MSWYVASEGRVLREVGEKAEDAAEFVIHDKMDELLTFHRQQAEST